MIYRFNEFIEHIFESSNDDSIVHEIVSSIDDITGEYPKPLTDLYSFIKKGKIEDKISLWFVEEIKSGRSSRFDKRAPLKLKGKTLGKNFKILVDDITFKRESEQESESDHRYINYYYDMKITKIN